MGRVKLATRQTGEVATALKIQRETQFYTR
uniref:Uncharacterized protein n=1 Tax=Arundo donax TaxID=35708 RepID=A0A0A9B5Z1_ARUDO